MKYHENVVIFSNGQPVYNPQKTSGHKPVSNPGKNSRLATVYNKDGWVGKGGAVDRYPPSVLEYDTPNSAHGIIHPTQKPVALFSYLIRTYTHPGAAILDNCAGSGTTAIAAIETGRNWFCIEKDAGYFEIAQRRIEERLQQPFLFEVATVIEDKPTQNSFELE
jgi:site-specific DNA-methyltransferase (adenine-specific)